jgi:hexosaminidase
MIRFDRSGSSSLRLLLLCLLLAAAAAAPAQPASAAAQAAPRLLPMPRSMVLLPGRLTMSAETPVIAAGSARGAALRFIDLIRRTAGIAPRLRPAGAAGAARAAGAAGAIRFDMVAGLAPEAYRLEVGEAGATITASDRAGLFYGGVTLWQVLTDAPPPHPGRLSAPALRIEDSPRFGWRGLMLDSARHFQSPAFVRRLIDWMAVNKLNRLHWHLTDDQGWRIEIRRYPLLTRIGGWRAPATAPGAPPLPRIGGYYTQAEVRAIVAYARARAIEIVPEIEMPGHALAAIRAYPALGTGLAPPPAIQSDWGVFPWLYNVDEPSFTFIENVLDEVLALFPGRFIHVGGDEAVKDQWRASPRVQARMRVLGIADEEALQSWFTGRIGRFLAARGRRLIGWDEILQGGLPAGAAVMSWRGVEGAARAAQAGHDAVLSPAPILYFDNRQGTSAAEPPGRGNLVTLALVYAFEPAPATLTEAEQAHILGLQANLWTEHIRTEARAAYMAFPRAIAVAERGWSPAGTRDFAGFAGRLAPQLARLGALGLVPSPSAFRPEAAMRFDPAAERVSVALSNQVGSAIRYTLDGRPPTPSSALYAAPLDLPLPARLRARGFLGGDALPGELDRRYDAASVRRRDSETMKLCSTAIPLALEDDAPAAGPRATFLIDIMNPCWIYEGAPLDGVSAIEVEVGQLPFNFQIGRDVEHIHFRPPTTDAGEIEVRAGGCAGERIAVLPLAAAAATPAVTRLRAPIAPRRGAADLCITYTARGPNPLWAVQAVQLVQGR